MARRASSAKRKRQSSVNLVGDNFDPGAIRHSKSLDVVEGAHTRYTSVEGDNHEDPDTGSHTITYPSRGNG